jgi:diguanylate cyclase (GGDEF)-like protein
MGIRRPAGSSTINEMRHGSERTIGGLSPAAAALEFTVVWLTIAGAVLVGWPVVVTESEWIAFCALMPLIAIVHLLGAEREKHQGSHLSLAPIFAAVLILPPALAAIAIAVAFFPESVRSRPRWYIVLFNVANFVGPALVARACFDALRGTTDQEWAFAALVAIAAFITVHYCVLAAMLRLARGVRIRETIRLDCVLIDSGLVSLGALAAALWEVNEALVVLTLAPLALAYRSLAIPGLIETTRIEPKTGLYNMRHFNGVVSQELQRARRFDRPLAVLMVDVDHLRDVNTAHGHVGGDRALRTVAASLLSATREYDLAARFGGDEFCVLLPETDLEGALVVAERVRSLVEQSSTNPPVTVSIGVASHRGGDIAPTELIALADRAAYRAKFSGRNTVAVPPSGDPVHEAERVLLDAIGGSC